MHSSSSEDEEDVPPVDFRFLTVAPTTNDLYDENLYLRKCNITEPYNSVEHYLDVQFRLLREDFFKPLRRGLNEYLHFDKNKRQRNADLRVYRKVKLLTPDINKSNVGIKISFGVLKHVNWQHSKRFMTGGLLLLSSNNFMDIIFLTVANRNEDDLKKGFLLVEPCATERKIITREMYKKDYVMLESKIYFEPYLAVLNAMRLLSEENFPMKRYLVEASNESRLPQYVERFRNLRYKNFNLPVLGGARPSAKQLNLDESQLGAFKHALTEELAVIQGPPGTGKTFLALEIVRALLESKDSWKRYGPIVVVCYTNHALDQFLTGIMKHTTKIVRIGARSKSEVLKPFTLMEKRKTFRTKSKTSYDAKREAFLSRRDLEDLMSKMGKLRMIVKYLISPKVIVPLECLRVKDKILNNMETNDDLIKWLFGENLPLTLMSLEKPTQFKKSVLAEDELNDNDADDETYDTKLELTYKLDIPEGFHCIDPLESINKMLDEITLNINNCTSGEQSKESNIPEDKPQKNNPRKNKYQKNKPKKSKPENNKPENNEPENNKPDNNLLPQLEEHKKALNQESKFLERQFKQHPLVHDLQDYYDNKQWRIYWTWVKRSYDVAMNELTELEAQYRQKRVKLDKLNGQVDLNILREHLIVGLTTTCAAKLHDTIRDLGAPIVLVEEAAEILEAHVLCSLTRRCQHLILIGDHKQLRPKASDYEIGRHYNLNVSLFERILRIRGNCNQLAYQHRMRPEIARLITPSIYETLFNHSNVLLYPNVKGLKKNLFFINHNNYETNKDEESYTNKFEAIYLIAFANHLIKQGYAPEDITVLCTYVGQLFELKKEVNNHIELKNLNVTTVDNYQGEENKLILLSLVRNNGKGNIGFLKEENRVCVALSRAREGLYIMGNMNDLVVKNNIWPKINEVLEAQNAIGDGLLVQCQIHVDQITEIKNPSDFITKCPKGGCLKKCATDLPCGHCCESACHIVDRDHTNYKCLKPCEKMCPNDHICPLACWVKCPPCQVEVERTLNCGHTVKMFCSDNVETFLCYVKVPVTLQDCKHDVLKTCSTPIEKVKCTFPCIDRLPCGHACEKNCHVNDDPDHVEQKCYRPCPRKYLDCEGDHECRKRCFEKCMSCPVLVEKKRSCGHIFKNTACSVKIEDSFCHKPCKKTLICGHKCPMKCSEPCGNCSKKVIKKSSCGHEVQVKCCENATPSVCYGKCAKLLNCGHPCTLRCKDPCTMKCEAKIKLTQRGLCGHILNVPCYLRATDPKNPILLQYCTEPCIIMLECGHRCHGTCGKCRQGRIHYSCTQPCSQIFVCGHNCEVPCRQDCLPCNRPCEVQCEHSKCTKKCGNPCTTCKEKCTRSCKHKRCSRQCGEMCDITPCDEPCEKLLKCNHPCVGFCGDPCPPLCRECDKEDLTEIFFGTEDEPDARFIYLEDCKHCIESSGLTNWMQLSDGPIQLKTCPRCKTQIKNCKRFMNDIKLHWLDVQKVKEVSFHNKSNHDLVETQKGHMQTLNELEKNEVVLQEFGILRKVLQDLSNRGSLFTHQKRRQNLSAKELDAFRIILQMLKKIFDILLEANNVNSFAFIRNKIFEFIRNQVSMLAQSIPSYWVITNQNITDIQLEISRLNYMIEVCKTDIGGHENDILPLKIEISSIERFTKEKENRIVEKIRRLREDFKKIDMETIVKAIGLKQGHWYKCPNGHPYAIGECGGAMEISKCADCGAEIGGRDHRTLASNSLASEIDGASRPAYPGQYGFGHLRY